MTKQMECATEFAKWLGRHNITADTLIYVDHKRFKVNEKGEMIFDIEAEPTDYFEFAGKFMSVSTEGPLYDILNYYNDFAGGYDDRMNEELCKLFEKFGYYFELGNAWNFSLYEI